MTAPPAPRPQSVMVSGPVRLHAHRMAYALQRAGLLQAFHTSLWYKPDSRIARAARALPGPLARRIAGFYGKRAHDRLDPTRVVQHPVAEIARLALDLGTMGWARGWLNYLQKQAYDLAIAAYLRRTPTPPEILVGYEISCRRSFAAARARGIVTVLDLAGLDHRFVAKQRERFFGTRPSRLDRRLARQKLGELALADRILCSSTLGAEALIDAGIARARITILPMGADLATFTPKAGYSESGPLRLLYVGNLSAAKGVDRLIEAVAGLDDAVELTLVGTVGEPGFTRHLREPRCRHLPYATHAALADLYRAADLLVLPSLYDGWGMVVGEAMACGTPAIVTANVGARELVEGIGWVVAPGSVTALQGALREAQHDRAGLAARGKAGIERVATLSWQSYDGRVAHCFGTGGCRAARGF